VFVPDRVTALTVAPVDWPKRADRTPLSTLNSWSASGNGIALPVLFCGSLLEPPSTRYCVLLPVPPATEIDTALGYCRLSVRPVTCTAAPDSTINWLASRPLSGRLTICSWLTRRPTPTSRVSTSVASACTVIVSERAPIFSRTFTERVSPTASTMPVCSKVLNPLSCAASL
jgi:hypothetical protein